MRGRFGKLFKNLRVVVLIICLILAISAIRPNPLQEGVAIRTILSNSSTNLAGMQSPKPNLPPMSREIVTAINNRDITSVEDYEEAIGLAKKMDEQDGLELDYAWEGLQPYFRL